MLNYLLTGQNLQEFFIQLLLSLPVIFFALSLHETAHGYVASKLGDPTAKSLGRLTLNPLKHIDPLGFLCMVLCGFGWAKPVPINSRYFKHPKRDMALSVLAGPVSNLILALIFTGLLKIFMLTVGNMPIANETVFWILTYLYQFLIIGVQLNVAFAIFNLLPIPPWDGSRLVFIFLPVDLCFKLMRYERYIQLVMMALLFFGVFDPVLDFLTIRVITLYFSLFGL